MEIFKELAEIYPDSTVSMSLSFKKDEISVSILVSGKDYEVQPINVNGSKEEFTNEKFIELLKEPLESIKTIVTNAEKVEKSIKEKAEKKNKKPADNKKPEKDQGKVEEKKEEPVKEEPKQPSLDFEELD